MSELLVRVEQRHIDGAPRNSGTNCPIARALREQHPREWQWVVGVVHIYRWPGSKIPLPKAAAKFSRDHRDGNPVEPFEFTLEIDETAAASVTSAREHT